jgi:Protein of unknown function (DUF2795)
MTQSGGTHGPRKDDALAQEVRGEVQANRAVRTEEWREPEPPGEDQPDATFAPAGRGHGDGEPDPDDIQLRSDLARHLGRAAFPADRAGLIAEMSGFHAPQQLLDMVATLPEDRRYERLTDLLSQLGLPVESRRS